MSSFGSSWCNYTTTQLHHCTVGTHEAREIEREREKRVIPFLQYGILLHRPANKALPVHCCSFFGSRGYRCIGNKLQWSSSHLSGIAWSLLQRRARGIATGTTGLPKSARMAMQWMQSKKLHSLLSPARAPQLQRLGGAQGFTNTLCGVVRLPLLNPLRQLHQSLMTLP